MRALQQEKGIESPPEYVGQQEVLPTEEDPRVTETDSFLSKLGKVHEQLLIEDLEGIGSKSTGYMHRLHSDIHIKYAQTHTHIPLPVLTLQMLLISAHAFF